MKTHIIIESLGSKKKTPRALVIKNGKTILSNHITQRGINMLILNVNLKIIKFKFYDFWKYPLDNIFRHDIRTLPRNCIIILTIKEDGIKKMNNNTRNFIMNYLESQHISAVRYKGSWCILIKKLKGKHMILEEVHENKKLARIENMFDLEYPIEEKPRVSPYVYNPLRIANATIKKRNRILKLLLKDANNLMEKMKLLHRYYAGEKCYIITCGPSLKDMDVELIKSVCGEHLVLTVKQAYKLYEEISDFHLLNFCNMDTYDYTNKMDTITVYMDNEEKIHRSADIPLVLEKKYTLNKFKSRHNRHPSISKIPLAFPKYLFTKRFDRPEGPGIMYEVAIYLAIHLGVSEINVISWDLDYKQPRVSYNTMTREKIIFPIEDSHFYGSNHHTNKEIDKIITENEDIIKSSKIIFLWLKKMGIKLNIISPTSKLDPIIPRIKLENIYDKLQQDGKIETKEEIEKLLEEDKKQKLQMKIDKNNKIKELLQKQLQKVRDELEVAKGKRNKKKLKKKLKELKEAILSNPM